jgi:ABC-type amino acid transport substrate-binding protein
VERLKQIINRDSQTSLPSLGQSSPKPHPKLRRRLQPRPNLGWAHLRTTRPLNIASAGSSREIVGFNIELAQYLGQKLGFKVKLQDMEFVDLIPALEKGKLDFAISALTPTP